MTPRERILAVLAGNRPDHTPFDIWYTPEVRTLLMNHFMLTDEQELWRTLAIDKIVSLAAPYKRENTTLLDDQGRICTTQIWGNAVREVPNNSGGTYEETVSYPLTSADTLQDLEAVSWPDPSLFDYAALQSMCRDYSPWVRMLSFISIFEIYCKLRPMDISLMDLYINQDLAHAIIDKIVSIQRTYIEEAFSACGDLLDIVYLSDDMGMQDRALIPLGKWEEMFLTPYRGLIDLIHAKGAYVFYHSDGAAFPIIERMVDLGVDVINPIQHNCPGMERKHLIEELGNRVVFHGAVENQQILPFGTPEEVQQEVRINMKILGKFNRYICASCHNLQPGTPLENILSLYRGLRSLP